MLSLPIFLSFTASLVAAAGLTDSSLVKHVNTFDLSFTFNPVKASYWTGYPHHRRTPFALSPDGTRAYLAYLDNSETDVHVQRVDPDTFAAIEATVTVTGGKEAGGLVAHNDGFALFTNEALPSGTANAPADSTPVPVLYRYVNGVQEWKTFLGGPGVHASDGLAASPDLNGDLAYSESAGMYGAYFVVTDYTGDAAGHFGDSVEYVADNGTLLDLAVSSDWGCSHNTGIAFEAADSPPFASICAEDQGAIWLNTETRGMTNNGVKISNENTTNGASNEPMGGMSGSYSGLARFQNESSYIFSWVSRGATDLSENTWMGDGYTQALNRTNNRNVAIALFSDKDTLVGDQAISTYGATDGDAQVNWMTSGTSDCSNAHAATFDKTNALVTWEEIANPECDYIAMGCKGEFSGSFFQLVNNGSKVGEPLKSMDTYVAGDMVTMADGRICWPYVNMTWALDRVVDEGLPATTTKQMSFACMSSEDDSAGTASAVSSSATAVSTAALNIESASIASSAVSTSSSPAASSALKSSTTEVVSSPSIIPTTFSTQARSTLTAVTSATAANTAAASTVTNASAASATSAAASASASSDPFAGLSADEMNTLYAYFKSMMPWLKQAE
ncbi:hypothetical protein MBLNU459_g5825t1 [Dothideomycetes sp. NU459]